MSHQAVYEHRNRSRLRGKTEAVSTRLTRLVSAYFGDRLPMYVVAEFPRSGGTWLSNMMADYLRCPKVGPSIIPFACRCVVHNHWRFHKRIRRCVYLSRDGRDVMTSFYFHRLRLANPEFGDYSASAAERMDAILGKGYDAADTATNLPKFLRYEFEHPHSAGRHNWATHVREWFDSNGRDGILYMTYEQLLADPVNALRQCVEHVSPITADHRLLERTVEHYAMAKVTGRKQGEEDRGSFVRKGIAGDWKNHYGQEAAEVFQKYAGAELIALGYETDANWVEQVD